MSNTDTKQDHPGPEWVESRECFTHYGMPYWPEDVTWGDSEHDLCKTRAEAVERCRAISAAALAWERVKAEAASPFVCQVCEASILRGAADIAAGRVKPLDDVLRGTSGEAADTTTTVTAPLAGVVGDESQ